MPRACGHIPEPCSSADVVYGSLLLLYGISCLPIMLTSSEISYIAFMYNRFRVFVDSALLSVQRKNVSAGLLTAKGNCDM
jgi:hypothetical protein